MLITVIVTLFIIASLSQLLNRESSMQVSMSASETHLTEARYVAEAGMQHALWQSNHAGCTGYPSSVTNNFGTNNYTVSVSPSSGSPVSISSTSTLATGESISLSRDNIKIFQTPNILSLQPDSTSAKDTHIYEFKPTFNYSNNVNLIVSAVAGKNEHSLIQFNLSSIPTDHTISSAKLELYENTGVWNSTTVNVHRVTTNWNEANSNWTEANTSNNWITNGGDFDSKISATTTTTGALGVVNWDITALVESWVNGGVANYGLLLRTTLTGEGAQFSSSNTPIAANRPKLTITYKCECGKVCGAAPFICNGNYRDEFNNRVYSGSDGSIDWISNPWLEVGESDSATTGDIQVRNDISDYQLRTQDNDNGGEGVEREANLSGATTASLEYEYRRHKLDGINDYTTVEISANGTAGPWTELARYAGPAGGGELTDATYTLITHDISTFISSNTRIRLKTSANMGGGDRVWFDSVQISCSP